MKRLFLLLTFLSACTTVNTNGAVTAIKYEIIRNGSEHRIVVESEASKCPILESEVSVKKNKAKLTTTCKTVLK